MTEGQSFIHRLDRAIDRFNKWALRLVQPDPHWIKKSIRIGFFMIFYGFILQTALTIAFPGLNENLETDYDRSIARMLIGNVLLAPILETLCLVIVYKLTWPCLRLTGFVLVAAVLASLAHAPGKGWLPVTAMGAFMIMAYQYVAFRQRLDPDRAFWGTALTHAINNGVATVILVLAQLLDG